MLHFILRYLLKAVFWVYYRKISFTGTEHVPPTGPVILACNHPNSFLDALIVGYHMKRKVHFLARSDAFDTPLKMWILTQLSMMPIYRLQEGMENLEKNKDTFGRCHELFDNNGIVIIFSEGYCIQEMRLRSLKKGTARIALEYIKTGKSLTIAPVGLNYPRPMEFRQDVLARVARSFDASEFSAQYNESNARAITAFNKRLEEGLAENVINIIDRDNEAATKQLVEVAQNDGHDLLQLVGLVRKLNDLKPADPSAYQTIMTKADSYREKLEQAGLEDKVVREPKHTNILAYLAYPFYVVGHLLNGLPLVTAKWLATTKVRRVEFYDSVLLGAAMFLELFLLIFVFIILLFIHPFWAVLVPGILMLTGALAVGAYDILLRNRQRQVAAVAGKPLMNALSQSRAELAALIKSSL